MKNICRIISGTRVDAILQFSLLWLKILILWVEFQNPNHILNNSMLSTTTRIKEIQIDISIPKP